MSIPFYRAFEDRHRGSRELIKGRQQVYLPFIEPLKQLYKQCPVLDLGCGRGEWLEILLDNGFKPRGVDLDSDMLEACQALGLPAEQADALVTLKGLPDESQAVVSGFHIAEHIPFADLQELVAEALRVLKPAGLLILETPNAENLVVGTQNFYLDPTHERPIPHLLLSFLTEYSGFARSKLLRLQEPAHLMEGAHVELMDVLGGVSPDYGIVAQKQARPKQMALFDAAFAQEYGLALGTLANRYEQNLSHRLSGLSEKVDCSQQNEARLAGEVSSIQQQAEQLRQQASHLGESLEHVRLSAESSAQLAAKAQAGASSLELRAVHSETVANQLRLQLQESLQASHHAEARYQTVERELREQIARAAQFEGRQEATQNLIEALQKQIMQATENVLGLYKRQQELETLLQLEQKHAEHLRHKLAECEDQLGQANLQLNEAQDNLRDWQARAGEFEAQRNQTNEELNASLASAHQWWLRAGEHQAELQSVRQQLNESLANAHNWYLLAGVHGDRVKALLSSASWRITWPLRIVMACIRWLIRQPVLLIRAGLRFVALFGMRVVLKHPTLKQRLTNRLKRYPTAYEHLKQFARHRGLLREALLSAAGDASQIVFMQSVSSRQPSLEHLSFNEEMDVKSHKLRQFEDVFVPTSFDGVQLSVDEILARIRRELPEIR